MTPATKAKGILLTFRLKFDWTKEADVDIIKQCALICVDELWHETTDPVREAYYEKVKEEINKF